MNSIKWMLLGMSIILVGGILTVDETVREPAIIENLFIWGGLVITFIGFLREK